MTGRELIIYILQHGLENDEIFKNGHCALFMTQEEAAVQLGVGMFTVQIMYQLGQLKGFMLGDSLFIWRNQNKGAGYNG